MYRDPRALSTAAPQKPTLLSVLRSLSMIGFTGSTGLIEKKRRAISLLRNHRGVLVALSGGVDSAVLLAIAREALGAPNVLAVTGRSAAVTAQEIRDAKLIASALGVPHEVVDTHELDSPAYVANSGDRCFHCRSELFAILSGIARARGLDAIAYGAILDDIGDDRPGMDAARRRGILAPLLEAAIGKDDVRSLAIEFNLHVQDKPAGACLASRIPIGVEVTPERLDEIAKAEKALRGLGFKILRVRHHGEVARIELGDGEAERLADAALRAEVLAAVCGAGFRFVTLDLAPYRSGGKNPGQRSEPLYSIGPNLAGGQ